MNAIIYCRVSSRDQVEGTSLDSQEIACRDYAGRHNLTVARVFIEEGESAKFADRTQLLELLKYCQQKSNGVETLIVWKLDRFARNVEDHFAIKASLRRYGVKVVSVTEPIDTDPNGRLMETILAGFAQFDNDIRALRSVQGMTQRLKDGIFPWQPPLGYLPPKIGKKTVPDYRDPQRFEPLQKAWELFATGAYSMMAIVRLLQSWGVVAYRGRPVSPQTLEHIFRNPYYAGSLRDPWSGAEYRGRHVAMVTRETFAQVQTTLRNNSNSRPHDRLSEAFPLRGLTRCPTCQHALTAGWSQGRSQRYPYYRCHYAACGARTRSYPAGLVHSEFSTFLAEKSVPAYLVEATSAAITTFQATELAVAHQTAQQLRQESKRLTQHLHELIAMRAAKLISDEEFVVQRARIQHEIHDLEAAAHIAEAKPLTATDIDELTAGMTNLLALWEDTPLEGKPGFGELLFPAGYVNGSIRTAELGLLFRVFDPPNVGGSNGVGLITPNLNRLMCEITKFLAIVRVGQERQGRQSVAA